MEKGIIDLSKARRSYYRNGVDLQNCPECGSELIADNCTILLYVKSKSDEVELMTNHTGSHFCKECPVVVFDTDLVEKAATIGIGGKGDIEFMIAGIVNLEAIPYEKRKLVIGSDDNPVPLVPFLPEKNITTIKAEEKPLRNEPCPCGSGKKYKKCCGK